MTVSPRERISCNSFGAAGRTRTCIAPIKSRALCLLSYDGTRYFPIREPRMRLRFCRAVVIVITFRSSWISLSESNRGSPHYGCGAFPAKLSQRFFFIGPHLEPLRRLERRSARYKPAALPAELQRQFSAPPKRNKLELTAGLEPAISALPRRRSAH